MSDFLFQLWHYCACAGGVTIEVGVACLKKWSGQNLTSLCACYGLVGYIREGQLRHLPTGNLSRRIEGGGGQFTSFIMLSEFKNVVILTASSY